MISFNEYHENINVNNGGAIGQNILPASMQRGRAQQSVGSSNHN